MNLYWRETKHFSPAAKKARTSADGAKAAPKPRKPRAPKRQGPAAALAGLLKVGMGGTLYSDRYLRFVF